jgi:hypothetical protein
MKQLELVGDWSLALHVRDDGECVAAILRANILQADLFCLTMQDRAFAILRVPHRARTTLAGRQIENFFAPARTALDFELRQALEATLSRELGLPTQLVLSSFSAQRAVCFVVVPPVSG